MRNKELDIQRFVEAVHESDDAGDLRVDALPTSAVRSLQFVVSEDKQLDEPRGDRTVLRGGNRSTISGS